MFYVEEHKSILAMRHLKLLTRNPHLGHIKPKTRQKQ